MSEKPASKMGWAQHLLCAFHEISMLAAGMIQVITQLSLVVCWCLEEDCLCCRERVEGLERSKASLGSKLAVAQEEVAHLKAELGDHSSQTAKLRAQLHSIHDAHSKVSCITKFSSAGVRAVVHLCSNCAIGIPCGHCTRTLSWLWWMRRVSS